MTDENVPETEAEMKARVQKMFDADYKPVPSSYEPTAPLQMPPDPVVQRVTDTVETANFLTECAELMDGLVGTRMSKAICAPYPLWAIIERFANEVGMNRSAFVVSIIVEHLKLSPKFLQNAPSGMTQVKLQRERLKAIGLNPATHPRAVSGHNKSGEPHE